MANLSVPLAGLLSLAFLGHQKELSALAGVALGSIIFNYIYWACGFLRMGTTALTSQATGAQAGGEVANILLRGLAWSFTIAGLLLLLRNRLLQVGLWGLGCPAAVEPEVIAYAMTRIWDAPATLGLYVVQGWLLGRLLFPEVLKLAVFHQVTTVALEAYFILHLGLGSQGAGAACALAAHLTFLLGLYRVHKTWDQLPRPSVAGVLDTRALLNLGRLNSDLFVRTLCLIACMSTLTQFSVAFGTVRLAANTIILKLLSTFSYLVDGIAVTLESLVGKATGAGQPSDVRDALIRAARCTALLVILAFLVLGFYGDQTLSLLTSHGSVIEAASKDLPWLGLAIATASVAYLLDGFFLGLGKTRVLRDSMLVSTLLGFLPLAYAARTWQNTDLLWLALAALLILRSVTLMMALKAFGYSFARAQR
jgi:MATE family multidrug resistance protein